MQGSHNPQRHSVKRGIFFLTLIVIPLLFFVLIEMALRIAGYGTDYALFYQEDGYYHINPQYPQKFFGRFDRSAPELIEQKIKIARDTNTVRIVCLGGSTTAGFPFEVNINFPVFLKCALQQRFPQKKWEVINLGVSAVNSHGVRHLAPEVLKLKPDLVLLYMGHNEFYGVFGPASARGGISNPALVQWFLKLKSLRLYQLLESALFHLLPKPDAPESTLMARMIKTQRVRFNSHLYRKTIAYFEENLAHILQTFQKQNVPLVLSPLVCNLKDQRPLGYPDPAKSVPAYQAIQKALRQKDFSEARQRLLEALTKQPEHPLLHYLLGTVYYQLNQFDRAHEHFALARDYDQAPFRAPSAINRVIVKLAKENNVPLAATNSLFDAFSPHGIADQTLFLEHLHPNERGYQLLARAFLKPIGRLFFAHLPSKEWNGCNNFSELDIAIGELKIKKLIAHAPFYGRTAFKPRRFTPSVIHQIARQHVQEGLLWDASHFHLGDYFFENGNLNRALKEYLVVLAYDSAHVTALYKAGDVYFKKGSLDSALQFYRKAAALHPRKAFLRAKMAQVFLLKGNVYKALNVINQILSSDALLSQLTRRQQAGLFYIQALAYLKIGKNGKARKALETVLQKAPSHAAALQLKEQLKQED